MNYRILIILFITSLSLSAKKPCKGLRFPVDPFNKDYKAAGIATNINNIRKLGKLSVIYDDNTVNLEITLYDDVSINNNQVDINNYPIPAETPLLLLLENGEQFLFKTENSILPAEHTHGLLLEWKIKIPVTREHLSILGQSKISGIKIVTDTNTYKITPSHTTSTEFFTEACECFGSEKFWTDITKSSK